EAVVGHGRAALDVEQRCIPRPTDLTREEPDGIGLHRGRERRIEHADARTAQVSPIALRFQSEDELTGLPAIPDLAAEQAAGTVAATIAEDGPGDEYEIPAIVALAPAAIGADVETAPVVDHRKRCRRRRLHGHIGS